MKKNIYIIGIGGRTGAMFCRELQGAANIIGIGMPREIAAIQRGNIKLERGGNALEILEVKTALPEEFGAAVEKKYPDFIWMTTRNPVTAPVEFYYRYFKNKDKIPALILSQNGLSAITDAKAGLIAAMGQAAEKVKIIRVSLINGIDLKLEKVASSFEPETGGEPSKNSGCLDGTSIFNYKLPIKLGFGAMMGQDAQEFKAILAATEIRYQEFNGSNMTDMENSKLFTNLIGMAATIEGIGAGEGLRDREMFKKEAEMLKEYVLAIKKSGSGFVADYCGYPIKFLAAVMLLPVWLLLPFRSLFASIVAKGRNRPKDLSEIDYYNGEVVKLGKKYGVSVPVNEEIIKKAKEKTSNQ